MSKCRLIDCLNEAVSPYPFCSGTCAYVFKNRKADLQTDGLDADASRAQLNWYQETKLEGNKPVRMNYTIEEAIHYLSL